MKTKASLFLVLTVLPIYSVTFGQTKRDAFIVYKDKVKSIICDSIYRQVTLSNKTYGSLTGYFKQDTICLIKEFFNQPYGYKEQIFLIQNDSPKFVHAKETTIKCLHPNAIYTDTIEHVTFDAFYEILGDKIIRKQKKGKPNQTDTALFDTGDPIPYQNGSAKYFSFHTKMYQNILLKKNGS